MSNNKINLLLGICSPRDINEFWEHANQLQYDKLIVKYHRSKDAYNIIRSYFLKHIEYTHLVTISDDLLVKPSHIEMLLDDIEKNDYQIITGMCNVTASNQELVNICVDYLPSDARDGREYYWLSTNDPIVKKQKIVKVMFAGFPCMIIRRDVIEKIRYRADIEEGYDGCCFDVMFCNDCYTNDIPIFLDTRVNMIHLQDNSWKGRMSLKTGIKRSRFYLQKI